MVNKNLISGRNKLFLSWLRSYIFVLLVPLLITSYVYFEAVNMIENEISKAHNASLRQLQREIDNKLMEIEKLSLEIGWNEKNTSIMYLRNGEYSSQVYTITNLIKDFKVYSTANKFISNIYVYYKYGDFVLSSSGKCGTEEFYEFYHKGNNVSYDKWLSAIKSNHSKSYISLGKDLEGSVENNDIGFFRSFPIESPDNAMATLVVVLDKKWVNDQIKTMKWMIEGRIIIVDKKNNIVASTPEGTLPDNLKDKFLLKDQYILSDKINGEDVVISYISSQVNDWKYISILPQKVFLQKAQYIRNVIYISILLCLLIGILASYYFTRKNYNPVRKLIQIFQGKFKRTETIETIGYDYIEESILKIIDENEEIKTQLDKQNDVLRNNFLERLIKGRVSDSISIREACESYGISFNYNNFLIIVFYIEDLNDNFLQRTSRQPEEIVQMSSSAVKRFIEQFSEKNMHRYIIEVDGILCGLVNFDREYDPECKRELGDILSRVGEFMKTDLGVYTTIAVSRIHNALYEICDGYEEALEAIEHKRVLGGGQVVYHENIVKAEFNQGCNILDITEKRHFLNLVKEGDLKKARIIIDDIFNKYFYGQSLPSYIVRYRMHELINIIFAASKEFGLISNTLTINNLNLEDKLLTCRTVQELQRQINRLLIDVEELMDIKSKDSIPELKDSIINYIEENYSNVNLSVSMIAENFNITEAHISRLFKKQTGWGVLEYIHRARIEKAKQLLILQEISIKEISEKVGFYNDVAFIRVFKKYEGVTPGKYIKN